MHRREAIRSRKVELHEELASEGIELWYARIKVNVESIMRRADLPQEIGEDNIFLSVRAGVDNYQSKMKNGPEDG
jgi:hypothetical protein